MDITKIKIGGTSYDIKDAVARTGISTEQEALIRNIMTYGIADISAKSQAELAQMAANMQKYGIPTTDGISQAQLEQMLANMQRYGVANVDGLSEQEKEDLEAAHNASDVAETDPMFTTWKTALLDPTSVDSNGVLTLI